MSDMSREARRQMRAKIHRITQGTKGPVDASSYGPEELLEAGVKTGMRPVSRRAFKAGGKVEGKDTPKNAGKKPRASGGKAMANDFVNRNDKDANESREGTKHVGGLKSGGRAKRDAGGSVPTTRFDMGSSSGSRMTQAAGLKTGGRAKRGSGSALDDIAGSGIMGTGGLAASGKLGLKRGGTVSDGELEGTRPTGGRLARKSGGKTNINIIIGRGAPSQPNAPGQPPAGGPGMPMPVPVGPPGLGAQGPQIPQGPMAGAPAPMPGPPPQGMPMGRKAGGRAQHVGAGSALGRLEKAGLAKPKR